MAALEAAMAAIVDPSHLDRIVSELDVAVQTVVGVLLTSVATTALFRSQNM